MRKTVQNFGKDSIKVLLIIDERRLNQSKITFYLKNNLLKIHILSILKFDAN